MGGKDKKNKKDGLTDTEINATWYGSSIETTE
jgi:hypothetical protein